MSAGATTDRGWVGQAAAGLDSAPRIPPGVVVLWDDQPPSTLNLLSKGMQDALAELGVPRARRRRTRAAQLLARVLGRAGLVRPLVARPRGRSITALAWASHAPLVPDAYWRRMIPWIWDCWGPQFPRWEALLRTHRIDTAFFTARDAARHFARTIPGLRSHWLPEACDPAKYRPEQPLAARGIHVLEAGRKHEAVHRRIRGPLADAGRSHRFALDGTRTPIFEGADAYFRGLGDTAIMLCFPKSVTHPDEAGGVETVTQRYFESIGSGCLTVGLCPGELRDLFGFDPVITLSGGDPAGHLLELLADIGSFQPHVERCRRRLQEVGSFRTRARQMLAMLTDATADDAAAPVGPAAGPGPVR